MVSLASYAFGQTFTVTPLELIRAQAACVNGGYLYTPYVVEQILDDEGNVTKKQVMRLSVTLDHRLLDGAVVAKFQMDLRDLLQNPMSILL